MLIDTHCHLTNEKFTDVKKTIAEAREVGVVKILMPSGSIEDSKRSILIAEQEEEYAMVGIHPEEVESVRNVDEAVKELEEMIQKSNRVIGVGEIGLDFFYDKEKKAKEQTE